MRRVSEVAKYVTKSADYLTADDDGWSADPGTIEAGFITGSSWTIDGGYVA
jgi:hypothetical protein